MDDEKLKQTPVVVLDRLTEEEIKINISPPPRSRLERRQKTEASKRLRDIERVDFSLFENYRQTRKHFLKKSEKRKRSSKAGTNLEKKSSKHKNKAGPENAEDSSQVHTDVGLKPEKKKRKKKHKDKEGIPKPKTKLRRVEYADESDSDNIENYGLFYSEEKNYQEPSNGFQTSYDYLAIFPFIDQDQPPPPVTFPDIMLPSTQAEDLDDLDIFATFATDFDREIEKQFSTIPDQTTFSSRPSGVSANDENLSALSLIEVVKANDDIEKDWDVVGNILNLMDFSRKGKPSNAVVSVPEVFASPTPNLKKSCDVVSQEIVPQTVTIKQRTNSGDDDLELIVKKFLDSLLKKVSARNRRDISLHSTPTKSPLSTAKFAKCVIKKCSLCQHPYTQAKNESICKTCKAYAVNELSSADDSELKKTDKIPVGTVPKSITKSPTSQKWTKQSTDKQNHREKFMSLKKTNRSYPVSNFRPGFPTRNFRSTILLTSPLKRNMTLNRKKTISPLKDSSKKAKSVNKSSMLKNLVPSERHRLLYKKQNHLETKQLKLKSSSQLTATKRKLSKNHENMSFDESGTSLTDSNNKQSVANYKKFHRHSVPEKTASQSENTGEDGDSNSSTSDKASMESQKNKNIAITNVNRGLFLMTFPDPDQDIDLSPLKSSVKNSQLDTTIHNPELQKNVNQSPRLSLSLKRKPKRIETSIVQDETSIKAQKTEGNKTTQSEMSTNSSVSSVDSVNIATVLSTSHFPKILPKMLNENKVDIVSRSEPVSIANTTSSLLVTSSGLQLNQTTGSYILSPSTQLISITPVPVLTLLPPSAPVSLPDNVVIQIPSRSKESHLPTASIDKETSITEFSSQHIPSVTMTNLNKASHMDITLTPVPPVEKNVTETNSMQISSQSVPSRRLSSRWNASKLEDKRENKQERVTFELEAVAILSVIDLEMSPDETQQHIERLLRKEVTVLNNLKSLATTNKSEDAAKVINVKMESCQKRIKCIIFACVLWIRCGSLEKVIEQVLSEQTSQTIMTADKEFETKKNDNDIESWYSHSLAVQAKKEKVKKSDCMFSGNNMSEERSFVSPGCYPRNATPQLPMNAPSSKASPFIESALIDDQFLLDLDETPINPKLEKTPSCMYGGNLVTNPSSALIPISNSISLPMSSINQAAAMPDLSQLNLPSPLESPTGATAIFNSNVMAGLNDYADNLLPSTLQTFTPEIVNQLDSCLNGSIPRMSPATMQSPSPRSLNQVDHGIHNNVPRMSPRTLQSPLSQSFNQLDIDSLLAQNMVSPSRRNSRNSTSSADLPVPQISPVNIKQEKDTRLNESPCANMNNAVVPYGVLPTPSPTPPQPYLQTQLQQHPQTQLQQHPQTQLQQHPQTQLQQHSQSQLPQHIQAQLQQQHPQAQLQQYVRHQLSILPQSQPNAVQPVQLSPQYQNLLRISRNIRSQNGSQAQLQQLLPALLNQTSSQMQSNSSERIPPPNKVAPFNNVMPQLINVNRNAPANISLQFPNSLPNVNRTVPPNISLQIQGSNHSVQKNLLQLQSSNPSVNRTVPRNFALQLQSSNNNVNRAVPTNISALCQEANYNSGANFSQQIPVSNSSMVFANQPVNVQQFLLSNNGVPTSISNQNNFATSYANNMQNTYTSSQSPAGRQSSGTAAASNLLINMLSQPQSNVYTVSNQAPTMNPPPSYSSSVTNTQNIASIQQANSNQREKLPHNLMYCAVCSKPATMRCKQCTKVVYCNASCARIYWHQKHKTECKTTC